MNSYIWWLLFLVVTLLLEMSSPGYFFFLSFSVGAVCAFLCSLLGLDSWIEFVVFLLSSGIAFYFLRRSLLVFIKDKFYRSNADALIGKKGVVIERMTEFEKGWIKIQGEIWAAIPVGVSAIEAGTLVEVIEVQGSHLRVKKFEGMI